MMYFGNYGYGMMWWGWIWMLGLIVGGIILAWWILKRGGLCCGNMHESHQEQKAESASDILNKRLAKGEITNKEYRKLKEELKKKD